MQAAGLRLDQSQLGTVVYMTDAVSHSDVQELVTRKGTGPRSP